VRRGYTQRREGGREGGPVSKFETFRISAAAAAVPFFEPAALPFSLLFFLCPFFVYFSHHNKMWVCEREEEEGGERRRRSASSSRIS